jgi:hypothetical protein
MKVRRFAALLVIVLFVMGFAAIARAFQPVKGKVATVPIPQAEMEAQANADTDEDVVTLFGSTESSATEHTSRRLYTITVKNFSPWYVDFYGDGQFIANIPPGWFIRFKIHRKGWHTGYAVCCCKHWGPKRTYIKKNTTWVLR